MFDSATLHEKLEALRLRDNIAGMSVAVTDSNGLIFSEGFGVESVERPVLKVTPHTLFKIASITKMINAITVMRLCEQGLLDLDTPIKNYIPWFELPREGAAELITLRHLLCHGAGLDEKIVYGCPRDERYTAQTLREILPTLPVHSLAGEGKFLYSNYGFVTVSCVVAAVTGELYTDVARRLTLEPLGMTNTFYHAENWCTYPVALPHKADEKGELKVIHRLPSEATRFGSGEVFSSGEDLCKIARLLMRKGISDNGERLLSKESVNEMLKVQIDRKDGSFHGLGIHIRDIGNHRTFGHGGWLPPYRGWLCFDPELDIGVAILYNTDIDNLRLEATQLILDSVK